ncbi:uncharacterized protein GIQ15_00351 [Arthroderma uncinatum]|uniref:uncharacterized protein n=1 Tax=Arthroderma uncinatum TaxID=74035 RepID=UPI00144A53DC|nr:uncharacterized protein GIQ15_00351 [Arthroderma uncinatum]KAF3490834.1 hypothetical protein GIQ15_00351 [Arthroderma uncinatum]
MPIRLPDSSISSISFDPLSPTSSDLVIGSSDSESDRDDAARAAKRRRIERVAQDYLQGHPPFILTAALNGPFDDGWVNPWRKVRKQHQIPQQNARIPTPQPASIHSVKHDRLIPPTLRAKPSIILGTDSHHSNDTGSEIQHRRISANLDSQNSSRRSSKSRSASTSGTWLKKDKTPLRRPLKDAPRSPSPSPSVRLDSSRVSKRQPERSHRAGAASGQVVHRRTLSFTAINAPVPTNSTSTPHAYVQKIHDSPADENGAGGLGLSVARESLAVSDKPTKRPSRKASLVHLSKSPNPGSLASGDTPTIESLLHENGHRGTDEPVSTGNTPSATNKSSLQNAALIEEYNTPHANETITSTNMASKSSIKCNTFVAPLSQRESEAQKTGSTLLEQDSETIPAAQIVPTIFTPPQLTPFTSADLLQLPFNQSNDSARNDSVSKDGARAYNQARASTPGTQGSGTNNACPRPMKGAQQNPPSRLRRVASSNALHKVIKPFHSFHGGPRATETGSKSTDLSNSTRVHDADETPGIIPPAEEQRASTDTRPSRCPGDGSTPKVQATHKPNKPATLSTPASCPAALLPQKDSHPSQPAARVPLSSLAEDHSSTVRSSGMPMSLTLAMSGLTDLSTQPDGQGLLVLQENFDLTGAIEDAESFLQSWDIERDRQRLRDNNAANGLKSPT